MAGLGVATEHGSSPRSGRTPWKNEPSAQLPATRAAPRASRLSCFRLVLPPDVDHGADSRASRTMPRRHTPACSHPGGESLRSVRPKKVDFIVCGTSSSQLDRRSVVLMMTKPYEGQADMVRLTAREGSGDPRAHGASVTRSLKPCSAVRPPESGFVIINTADLRPT